MSKLYNLSKKTLILLFVLFVLISFTTVAKEKKTYYFVAHGSADYYWVGIFDGAKAAGKNLGIDMQIDAPPGAIDLSAQLRMLESALASNPAGIVTTCSSETIFSSVLQRAKKMGVPVIIYDSKPKDAQKNPFDAFIGSDPYNQGLAIAEKAVDMGKVKDKVLIVIPQVGNHALDSREKAIKSVVEKHNVKVFSILTGTDPSRVQMLVNSFLIRNPDTSAIFSLTSQSLIPIGDMIKKDMLDSKHIPNIFSFDNTPETAALMKDGIVNAVLDQQQFLMGYYGITELYMKNKYGYKPVNIDTGYRIITNSKVLNIPFTN